MCVYLMRLMVEEDKRVREEAREERGVLHPGVCKMAATTVNGFVMKLFKANAASKTQTCKLHSYKEETDIC